MWIEPLESRRMLSATGIAAESHRPEVPAALHIDALTKTLSVNIVGSYHGFYLLGTSTFNGTGGMTITGQTTKGFRGTLAFSGGATVSYKARLTQFKNSGSQGPGYYFTFPYKTGRTLLQCKGTFQLDANGFDFQFTGKLNGARVPKPHGEFILTPNNPSTFLR